MTRKHLQHGLTPDLNRLRRQFRTIPWLDGEMVRGNGDEEFLVTISATLTVAHTLGREPRGFILLDNDTGAGGISMSGNNETVTFSVTGGGTAVVKIWIW